MIYLDYQATTPVAPEVVAAMRPWIEEKFANPHSPSTWGREAAAVIEVARDRVLTAVGLDEGRFAFTSGATEAINWAIKGTMERSERRRVATVVRPRSGHRTRRMLDDATQRLVEDRAVRRRGDRGGIAPSTPGRRIVGPPLRAVRAPPGAPKCWR